MKIITEQEESSLKENEPPAKEKKSMKMRAKNRAEEEFPEEDLCLLSNGEKKKKKKKKKKDEDENANKSPGSVEMSQPPLSKKRSKFFRFSCGVQQALQFDSFSPVDLDKKQTEKFSKKLHEFLNFSSEKRSLKAGLEDASLDADSLTPAVSAVRCFLKTKKRNIKYKTSKPNSTHIMVCLTDCIFV